MPGAVTGPVSSRHAYQADAHNALRQINARLDLLNIPQDSVDERRAHYVKLHCRRVAGLRDKEQSDPHLLTPEYLTACIREQLDPNTLVMNEDISNYQAITDHLNVIQPGSVFASGGAALGWHGGAAAGAKLAFPNKTIIALTGDGSYMMSDPSSVRLVEQ
jgi:acetolactate synthase I/II/III large subunit